MAVVTGNMSTYDATAIREDLNNVISNLSPEERPFMESIGRRDVSNTTFEWQVEDLPSVVTTAREEGAQATNDAHTATVRVSNVTQILARNATVSGTQLAVDNAGKGGSDELSHQMALISRALARDVESVLLANQAKASGSDGSPTRSTAGMGAWIKTNVSMASDGTNPTDAVGGDARNDGTPENFTETRLKDALKLAYTNASDQPSMIMTGPYNKGVLSGFSGRASATQVVALPTKADEVQATVSVYIGDFGTYKSVTNRFQRDRDVWIINPEYAKVAYLRPFEQKEISVAGDAEKRQITVEFGLECTSEKAHALVADNDLS